MKGRAGMGFTVRELAELVHGRVSGDPDLVITSARPVGDAGEGAITFLENERRAKDLATSRAEAFVVPETLAPGDKTFIHVADPLGAFGAIFQHFRGSAVEVPTGIDARAAIHPTAQIGLEAFVGPFVSIGEGAVIGARCRLHSGVVIGRGCKIGDDSTLFPHVVLYDDVVVGQRVIIHGNAVLGADGFGYRLQNGRHVKVPQLGSVEIGDDVEIGACSAVDRGTFKNTQVGAGTKIDNHVQVGHNCRIGAHNLIVSHCGIAGSCSTGAYVVLAGQAGIADHIHVGDGSVVAAQSGVWKDVAPGMRVLGTPAGPEIERKRALVCMEKLPELFRDIRRIKRQLGLIDESDAA
jgi:UDP-3-O-[3-hydroxymyristoyl] glucosamine N-acyltransferase